VGRLPGANLRHFGNVKHGAQLMMPAWASTR
jgi:hypothetical protein